jgi:hypothetical protein
MPVLAGKRPPSFAFGGPLADIYLSLNTNNLSKHIRVARLINPQRLFALYSPDISLMILAT